MDISKFRQFGRKIICVGRNYKALAAEQGKPIPKAPIVFFKLPSSYITEGENIKVPPGCTEMYHEVELGVVMGTTAKSLSESQAMDAVAGYALCLDMTAWNFQCEAKADGLPWALGKGFDTACPVSGFIPKAKLPDLSQVRIWMKRNDEMKHDSLTTDMIFPVPHLISYVSQYITLEPGDLLLTGSPGGAGPVSRGDALEAGLDVGAENVTTMKFSIE